VVEQACDPQHDRRPAFLRVEIFGHGVVLPHEDVVAETGPVDPSAVGLGDDENRRALDQLSGRDVPLRRDAAALAAHEGDPKRNAVRAADDDLGARRFVHERSGLNRSDAWLWIAGSSPGSITRGALRSRARRTPSRAHEPECESAQPVGWY
jgi:hypothetical protein